MPITLIISLYKRRRRYSVCFIIRTDFGALIAVYILLASLFFIISWLFSSDPKITLNIFQIKIESSLTLEPPIVKMKLFLPKPVKMTGL